MYLITDLPVTLRLSCDLLIMDIGSNDLAQMAKVSIEGAELLADYLLRWALHTGAKHVLFLGVLPRLGGLRGSADHFRANREQVQCPSTEPRYGVHTTTGPVPQVSS